MRRITVALVAIAVAPFSSIVAQDPFPVQAGDQIRITAPGVFNGMGAVTLVAVNSDTLVVQRDPNSWYVPHAAVTRLEVRRGQKSFGAVRGAVWGLLIGTSVGALGGYALGDDPPSQPCDAPGWLACWDDFSVFEKRHTARENALLGALAGGIVGVLVGRRVGTNTKIDRWEEVPLDGIRVSLAPQRDGFSVGVSVAF